MVGYNKRAVDQYASNNLQTSSPEQIAMLLLSAGQRCLYNIVLCIKTKQPLIQGANVNKALDIITALIDLLNPAPSQLTANLLTIYKQWIDEIHTASMNNDVISLERISKQMGEFKDAWEIAQENRLKNN